MRSFQSLAQTDFGQPLQQLARARNIGPAPSRVLERQRSIFDDKRDARNICYNGSQLRDRDFFGISEVERQVARTIAFGGAHNAVDKIVNVTKRSRLLSVACDRKGLAIKRGGKKCRDDASVVNPHSRSVRVKNANDARVKSA